MKLASITVTYQDEQFIRPHFRMLQPLDEHLVILGFRPFVDYKESGRNTDIPDSTIEKLKEFPEIEYRYHNEDYFCGNIFNLGMERAQMLGCDAIVKFDPDMFVTAESWAILMEMIKEDDWDVLLLDYKKNTMAYKMDMDHGHLADIFPVGCDPLVVRINQRFIQNGVKIAATGRQKVISDPNFMVHHFTGFKSNVDGNELRRVEGLPGFKGWQSAPQEIQDLFI